MAEWLKYFLVYLSSTVKFIFGPVLGEVYHINILVTGTLSILGMMTTVYLFTYFGAHIRSGYRRIFYRSRNRKVFSKKSRRYVRIWIKYGVLGIALLTPIVLSPPLGTILAHAFGGKKTKIIKYMWISSLVWGYTLAGLVKFADLLLRQLWTAFS